MKRSPLKPSSKAMKRTATKRKTPKSNPRRSNQAFLDACRGEPCHLRIKGVCLGASGKETVVPCHSNQLQHGKGMGIKAHDMYTVPGCMACHSWVDQGSAPKDIKFLVWDRAFTRWEPRRARKLRAKENPDTVRAVLG